MKTCINMLVVGVLLTLTFGLFAETPIRTSSNWDSEAAIAYNSTNDEYLVVWSELGPMGGGTYILGPVVGQRVKADGTLIGSAFTIFSTFSGDASVAYNPTANEYLVVFSHIGIQGQRISAAGTLIGSPTLLMANTAAPKIVYNSLDNSYLLIATDLYDSGLPDLCNIKVYSRRIAANGQPGGNVNLLRDQGHGLCTDGPRYAIAYSPITAAQTPKGRFLLVIDTPADLTMLDHNGSIVSKVIDSQSGSIVDNHVPFQQSKIGIALNVDVAYGNWQGEKVFMIVWGDRDKMVGSQQWTGIWAGIVNATPIEFDSHAGVSNTVFPISKILFHKITIDYAKSWAPVVAYNKIAEKFMVAWRETPTTAPNNDTKVNHIRANAVDSPAIPPPDNIVLSSVTGNEDPKAPAIAASTKNANALVVWEDARNFSTTDIDLYGNLFNTTPAQTLQLTAPNGGETWAVGSQQEIKWTSANFTAPVRIDFMSNNTNPLFWTNIVANTPNDGSFIWNLKASDFLAPEPLQGKIRVADATKNDPDATDNGKVSDWSDASFTINPAQNTPTGKGVNVDLASGIAITFDDVTSAGNTTLNVKPTGSPPPNGFLIFPSGAPQYYNITTTATFTGNIKICIKYDDSSLTPIEESKLRLYVYETPPGKWKDITTSLDVTNNVICGTVSHLSEFAMMLGPVHFTYTSNTGESYSLVIDNATLDGAQLTNGDEIGVFTPAGLCVGASVWDGTTPLALTAWADDSQTNGVDGYKSGDKMSFRIWDAGTGTNAEYAATPTYSAGNGNFGNGAFARVSLIALTSVTQALALQQGWSWLSFNVEPQNPSMESIMAGVANLVIVVNNAGQFYIPNAINSIGNLSVLEGYKIYVKAPDQVSVTGKPVTATTPIALKSGWNFVSYLPATAMSVETALASVLTQLAIIKNDAGKFFIPNAINSLGNMTPGEGYKLYLKADATLTYPPGSSPAKGHSNKLAKQSVNATHFAFRQRTGESFSVVVKSNGQRFKPGDEIGVFTPGGLCVGAGVCDGSGILGISAWADDDRTDIVDGFRENEIMHFKLWDANKDHEVTLEALVTTGSERFDDGAFAVVELASPTLPTTFSLEQNYPNPFNAGTMISYQLPASGKVTLTVYNLLGERVRLLLHEDQEAGAYSIHWDGKDRAGRFVPSGVYLYRIQAGGYSAVRKAVFVK